MSNDRSPRAVCSTTIGTRGMSASLSGCECATGWLRLSIAYTATGQLLLPIPGGLMSDQVQRELELEAPPEQLWEIITGNGWLADEVQIELAPGGEARFRDGAVERTGWVEEARAPERLTFWWSAEGESASRVELTLRPGEDGRTVVRVVEARPLDQLDLVGLPLPGADGRRFGPALVA